MPTHDRSSRQIEREIDDIRADIDRKAELIQDCLSPSGLMDRARERLHTAEARTFFENLGRGVRDNPLPVLLTGVGLAWLMNSTREHGEGEVDWRSRREHGISSGRARRAARRARRRASSVASRARERLRGSGHGLAEAGRRVGRGTGAGAQRMREGWNRMADEQPLLLGVLGLAVGALAGGALPPTETEDEWMGEQRDEFAQRAARVGRERIEQMREDVVERESSGESSSGYGAGSSGYESGGGSYGSRSERERRIGRGSSYESSSGSGSGSGSGAAGRGGGGSSRGSHDGDSGRNGGGSREPRGPR